MLSSARRFFVRLSPFERSVADAAADKILREMGSLEKQRQAAQERERHRLINSGVDPKDAANLARGGGGHRPWLERGNAERRARRLGMRW